jgi:hypothetical protein
MLKEHDIVVERGRGGYGGDFLRLEHVPTGKSRKHPGPLGNTDQRALLMSWLSEIEAELQAEGLTQYIDAEHSE